MPKIIATYTNKNGETKTLTEWSNDTGISRDTLYHRVVNLGMTIDEAIEFVPGKNIAMITDPISGETHSVHEWASILGIPYNTLRFRIRSGYTDEEVLHAKNREIYKVKPNRRKRVYKSMDLTGRKFGKLTVIKKCDEKREGEREWRWVCECDCPDHNTVEVLQSNLLNGHCTSCGCSNRNAVKDLTGMKFGYLEVIERDHNKSTDGSSLWRCKCQCGNEVVVSAIRLRSARDSISCGKCNSLDDIDKDTIHDLYVIYMDMHRRCYDKNDKYYYRYGERGIVVCDEWKRDYDSRVPVTKQIGFVNFCRWAVTHGYKKGLTNDRIDNDYIYCPDNCHWVTMKEQQNNRCNNFNITCRGETKTAAEWSEGLGISSTALRRRINNGMSHEEAIDTPIRKERVVTCFGETHPLNKWEEITGIKKSTIDARISRLGWSAEAALTTGATNPEIFNHIPCNLIPLYFNLPPAVTMPAIMYYDILGNAYTPEEWEARQAVYFD